MRSFRNFSLMFCLAASIGACGQATDEPQSSADTSVEEQTVSFTFSADDLAEQASVPSALQAVNVDGVVELAPLEGYEATVSSGTIGSAFTLALSPEVEAAFSGAKIRVSLEASGGPFKVSYSTNEVGNSGWQEFAPSDQSVVSFDYDVPAMVDGKGDFLGIGPTGLSSVMISSLTLEKVS